MNFKTTLCMFVCMCVCFKRIIHKASYTINLKNVKLCTIERE